MSRRVLVASVIAGQLGLLTGVAGADDASLAALLARTDAVAKEVSRIRGLPLKHPIANEVVDKDELRARLEKMAADHKTAEETAAEGLALARWGMIPLDTDYTHLMIDLLTDQIAGYYDADTKKLTISKSAGDDPDWAEMVLAHEIDHGLQDQTYDLHAFEDLPDSQSDASLARHALVEGDGIALMIEVLLARRHLPAPWANPEVALELEKAMSLPTGDSLDHAPLAVREVMLFPYRAGFAFVASIRRRHSWRAVDAAYLRPPRSTEQVLHPEKYTADEVPIAIAAGPASSLPGYQAVSTTTWGELGFQLFLRSHGIGAQLASEAAAGWGGDLVVVLARPGETHADHAVGIARTEWDTEADAIEAHEAAVRAIDRTLLGATVENTRTRTRWLGVDGRVSWVERKGTAVVMAIGVPAWAAADLRADAWTFTATAPKPNAQANR